MPTKKKVSTPALESKKSMVKSVAKKRVIKKVFAPAPIVMQEPMPPREIEVCRKYVLLGSCNNCEHLPMSSNRLFALMAFVIIVLSGVLISLLYPASNRATVSIDAAPLTVQAQQLSPLP